MGSWSETCALSNLPISIGDEIVWLLLAESGLKYPHGVYFDDFYWARSLPLYGKYDDYGRPKFYDTDSWIFQRTLWQFKNDLVPYSNPDRDEILSIPEVSVENLSEASFWEWIHEGTLKISPSHTDRHLRVAPIMILRSVWDAFTESVHRNWDGPELSRSLFIQQAEESLDHLLQLSQLRSSLGVEDSLSELVGLPNNLFHAFIFGVRFQGAGSAGASAVLRAAIDDYTSDLIEKEDVLTLFHRAAELSMVESAMIKARMCWHLTMGSGSQAEASAFTSSLHLRSALVGIQKVLSAHNNWVEEYGEEPEDEWELKELEGGRNDLFNLKAQVDEISSLLKGF